MNNRRRQPYGSQSCVIYQIARPLAQLTALDKFSSKLFLGSTKSISQRNACAKSSFFSFVNHFWA
ncbi:hypothetical protein, partial [Lacrimispora sp.]|uniref:hypothetical protein n=1 Tax=Lacrimispora sp. TaxID=2719234 RepID=UPI0028A9B891